MKLYLYEVVIWGGIGEMDTVFLASATSVEEAADLVCDYHFDTRDHDKLDLVFEIAPDPRDGAPTVIIGPCKQLASEYGWKKWQRSKERKEWVELKPGELGW